MQEHVLSAGWQLKARTSELSVSDDFRSDEGWIAATVPGTVHDALWQAGKIGDPYAATEQPKNAWIAEREFLYRCRFDLSENFVAALQKGAVKLLFDGLDTIATVWLNEKEILRSDNMFVPAEVDVAQLLREQKNDLWIRFEPALLVGRAREAKHGQRPVWNGDNSRLYVRKAQYQYGWDFGPTLLSAGPWQPVRLIAYTARIADIIAPIEVAADLTTATLPLSVHIERHGEGEALGVHIELHAPNGVLIHESTVAMTGETAARSLEIAQPALWWPHGHGSQPLYKLTLQLLGQGGQVLDARRLRLGARRIKLVQNPLPDGENFYFEINNRPVYCGGANWIPADLQPSRVTKARYRVLLKEAIADNFTMLRVWGGGIYETDAFYDLCDELGILVWQDFLFACGLYPAYPEIADSIAAEARAAIKRLRHRASLIIWAGNNEDYSIAGSVRAYQGPDTEIPPPGPSSLKQPIFDGRKLYEQVLARQCAEHDPSRPYWPGSPYSRRAIDPNSPMEGDRHIWEIWHFPMLDYQMYGRVAGRFASEFGMQAVPDLKTIARALPGHTIDENALVLLNKGQDGPGRIREYIERNLPAPKGLDDYIYSTQLIQAEALSHAVRSFRRQFDAERKNGGALIWQFDDCWPGVSWSMLNFCDEGEPIRRKPSAYGVRRELAPWVVGLEQADDGVTAWAISPPKSSEAGEPARLRVRAYNLDGTLQGKSERDVTVIPNQALELGAVNLPKSPSPLVYGAELLVGDVVVAKTVLFPQPLRKLELGDPGLQIKRTGDRLKLSVARPAKAVLLSAEFAVDFSDNLLDLLPDETVTITAPGLGDRPLAARSLFGAPACF